MTITGEDYDGRLEKLKLSASAQILTSLLLAKEKPAAVLVDVYRCVLAAFSLR